jgi:capsular exopolysaccharide synthesis family protein
MPTKPQTPAKASSAEINIVQEALRFARVLRRRWRMMVLAVMTVSALGGLYYSTTTRIYESRATLLVQQNQPETWSKQSGDLLVKDLMETYRSMLGSEVVLGDALGTLPTEARADLASLPPDKWMETLRRNLTVSIVRKTNILEITYRSRNAAAAAMVVDNIVSAYLKFMDRLHKSNARDMLDILTREKARLEGELNSRETELLALKQQIGDVILREGENYVSMLAKALEGDFELLRKAHGAQLEAESQWKALEAAIQNGDDLQQYALAMVTDEKNAELGRRLGPDSQTLARIQQQLLENAAELRAAQARYGPAHSKVRELTEKVQAAENFLRKTQLGASSEILSGSREELSAALRGIARQRYQAAAEYAGLVGNSYEVKKRMAMSVQNDMARLEVLNRDLNRMYKSLDVLTEQIKGIEIGKDNGMLGTVVLSKPEVPNRPVKPSLLFVAFASLVLGLGGGLGTVYLVDVLDDRFGTIEEMRHQLGGVPVLAMVRRLEPLGDVGLGALHAYARPNDLASEAFRTLRTALSLVGEGTQTVSVSSAEPGDGKTTVVANLAVAMALSGKRTLLIDADIRRPRLTPLLNLRGYSGLTTLLRQTVPVGETIADCLCAGVISGLDVVPSGPRAANAAELLVSERLPELLAWAEPRYDYIFIDSPPAFVSDVAVIGRLADGVVLVIRPDKNRRRIVIRAVEGLTTLGVSLFGLVLNHFTSDESRYGYDYEYRYDYSYGYGPDDPAAKEELDNDDTLMEPVPIIRRSA